MIETGNVHDCTLGQRLFAIPIPDPQDDDAEVQAKAAVTAMLQIAVDLFRDCVCSALLPKCAEACEGDCVPLAVITVRSSDLQVLDICNWIARQLAITMPTLQYWLGWIPVFGALREALVKLCCTQGRSPGFGLTDTLRDSGDQGQGTLDGFRRPRTEPASDDVPPAETTRSRTFPMSRSTCRRRPRRPPSRPRSVALASHTAKPGPRPPACGDRARSARRRGSPARLPRTSSWTTRSRPLPSATSVSEPRRIAAAGPGEQGRRGRHRTRCGRGARPDRGPGGVVGEAHEEDGHAGSHHPEPQGERCGQVTEWRTAPRFYEGQYLAAADLTAAVDYTRTQRARMLLGAHRWGIALGLDLMEVPGTERCARRCRAAGLCLGRFRPADRGR